MILTAKTRLTLTAIGMASAAFAIPATAHAQIVPPMSPAMSDVEVRALPSSMQSAPASGYDTVTTIGADGVETITRTRRIESRYPQSAPSHHSTYPGHAGYPAQTGHVQNYAPVHGYAPTAQVFQREQWINECERRTRGRDDGEKGGIIGGLLGAIAGGIIGNRVSDAERLGGTLLGAGVGGLGGLLIGSLVGGGRDRDGDYDCEAALDSYLSQYGHPGVVGHVATRTIPAPAYHQGYPSAQAHCGQCYSHGYTYAPPAQVVYVPVRRQQQQRVIVRETVREELVSVPATRNIPAPRPVPRQPRYIKGN